MTSEAPSQCFVHITLPGSTQAVTAGRFVLEKDRHGASVGRFVYGRSYLERKDCVPLDPVELKLGTRTYATTRLNGVFGALRDAGPDHWGRRVIALHAGIVLHAGKPEPNEIEYLLESPDDRAGALSFGLGTTPPAPTRRFNRTMDLARIQELADKLLRDDPEERPSGVDAQQVEDLLLLKTSMGGARPKAVVEDDGALWIAKFERADRYDRWNHPKVEHAMLTLAQECGVNAAASRLTTVGEREVLLVKRFDRQKHVDAWRRSRMVSALTVLQADEEAETRRNWSYLTLADEIRRIGGQKERDLPQLFRRMCFNALISNVDDHPRNHALLANEEDWHLSPAYDITPTPMIAVERRDLAMDCGDRGRYANKENLLSQCRRFLLDRDGADRIIDAMEEQVRSRWYPVARSVGVSERDCETIRNAFVYEGFGFPLDAAFEPRI